LCDGALSGGAAQDLEELTGRERFLSGGDHFLEPGGTVTADLQTYVSELSARGTRRNFCEIAEDATLPAVLAEVAFSLERAEPPSALPGYQEFAAGEHAGTVSDTAVIVFPCASSDIHDRYVTGEFYTPGITSRPDLRINILTSVARAVAEGLGCLEGAGLPEGRPEQVSDGGE
jgi:hypothetical protein